MPDDAPDPVSPTADAPGVPDTIRVDASRSNPDGALPVDGTLPGAVATAGGSRRRDAADLVRPGGDSGGSDRRSTLRADGGADPDRNPDYDGVRDAGIVVRLESDGVLLHAGAGRTDGRWIATDRETLVSREEMR